MTLQGLKNEIIDTMKDSIMESIQAGDNIAVATVNTTDGYIDCMLTRGEDASCLVSHDDDVHKSSSNLEGWVERILRRMVCESYWRKIERESRDVFLEWVEHPKEEENPTEAK